VSQLKDLLLDLRGSSSRAAVRPRGTIKQARLALDTEAGDPAVCTLARDAELLGDVRDRAALLDHPGNEQTTAMEIQTSVSVGHEDLLVGEDVRHLH
jgi:hypothetical protein